jgi:methionyl-tRNA formyltransferase
LSKELRTVLLYSGGHLGSSVALHFLSQMPEIKIVGIVRGDPAPMHFKGLIKIYKRVQKIGIVFGFLLAWQRFFQFLLFYLLAPLLSKKSLKSGWQISQNLGIPTFSTENINGDASKNFLETLEPDLIISVYFNQILKKETLNIPKIGSINLHPGSLPEYRGAFIYFWVLRNEEPEGCVTIHWMDEGIDTGKIISKKYFKISNTDTQQQVMVKSAISGVRQLQSFFRKILGNNAINHIDIKENITSNYYKFPEKIDFNRYIKKRKFFRHKDIVNLIVRRVKFF